MLEGVVKIGKIDKKLIPSLKIDKSPTYIFTRSDEPQNSKPFTGKFGKAEISTFCLEQLSTFIKSRESKNPESSSSEKSHEKKPKEERTSSQSSGSSNTVIELNDKIFE